LTSRLGPDTFKTRNALRGLKDIEHRSNFLPPQFLDAGDSDLFFFLNNCVTPRRADADTERAVGDRAGEWFKARELALEPKRTRRDRVARDSPSCLETEIGLRSHL